MSRRGWLLAAAVAAASLAPAEAAEAAPPAPSHLEVEGGDGWRRSPIWDLRWTNPPTAQPPVTAVRYVVRDPAGAIIEPETRLDWPAEGLDDLVVFAPPGVFSVSVRLEDANGELGPASTATLRYDNRQPASVTPVPAAGWIGRNSFPHTVRIQPPAQPFPVSGIAGYAIAIDSSPSAEPCAAARFCTEGETDLRGGPWATDHAVAGLPEGTSHVHVVAVSGSGMRSELVGRTALRIDTTYPFTVLEGVPGGWSDRAVTLTARAFDTAGVEGAPASGVAETAIQIDDRAPLLSVGSSASVTVADSGVHRVTHYARDVAGNVADGATMNGLRNPSPASTVVRVDREPPTVSFRAWQDPDDPELIEARVADRLSGPSSERGAIEYRPVVLGGHFTPLPTTVDSERLLTRWDSEAHPSGEYEFRAVAFDAAGNSAATRSRPDGSPMVLSTPLKAVTKLLAGFGGRRLLWTRCASQRRARRCRQQTVVDFSRRPTVRVVPYGRRVSFGGRLTTGAGTPVAGETVKVVERFEDGAPPRVAATSTDADGRFLIRLVAGPSREVSASFEGTRALALSAARGFRLGVRGRVRLRVSARTAVVGGRPILFRGRVIAPQGALPPEGKSLSLQFRLPGLEWAEFRTLRTDRSGRFSYRYRFSDDDSRGVRFQFRAEAPAQAGWPYEPAASAPVFVRGK